MNFLVQSLLQVAAMVSKKLQLLSVQCQAAVQTEGGKDICPSERVEFLGAVLDSTGDVSGELSRGIGMAKSDFRSLSKIWRRSCLSFKQKLQIYIAMVEARLLYSLSACCLTVAMSRRVDGFQAK